MKTRRVVLYSVLFVTAALLFSIVRSGQTAPGATYSQFVDQVEAGNVREAVITPSSGPAAQVTYSLRDGTSRRTLLPSDYTGLLDTMRKKMINIEIREYGGPVSRVLVNSAPFLILLGFWFFAMWRLKWHGAR